MTTEELKPCPACGGAAKFERIGTSRQSNIVACTECGLSFEDGATFNHAEGWNSLPRRADDQALKREAHGLLSALAFIHGVPAKGRKLLQRMEQAGWDTQPEQQETTGNDQ
jgi:ribosomal protein L37AE/L43A